MNLSDLKSRAANAALRAMSNPTVRDAVGGAVRAGNAAAEEFRAIRDEVRRQLDADRPVDDDTAAMKARLDRLRSGD